MTYLWLLIGFTLLLVSGDILVRGAVALSQKLNIPAIVIGLTVVAFGTSAPELVVSVRAAFDGMPGMAVGNIVGSNVANILLVLGIPSIIAATDCKQPFLKENIFILLGATALFIGLSFTGTLVFWHGALMFACLLVFLFVQAKRASSTEDQEAILGEDAMEMLEGETWMPHGWVIAFLLIIGLIGLPLGANITIDAATLIAKSFGISDAAIAVTIIALGTSLPELAATIPAALRGHAGMALGNIIGSNIFNILAVMGITSMIAPVRIDANFLQFDYWVMLAALLVLMPFILREAKITRLAGLFFFLSYLGYMYYTFISQKVEQTAMLNPMAIQQTLLTKYAPKSHINCHA